jgi:hypothetical protein
MNNNYFRWGCPFKKDLYKTRVCNCDRYTYKKITKHKKPDHCSKEIELDCEVIEKIKKTHNDILNNKFKKDYQYLELQKLIKGSYFFEEFIKQVANDYYIKHYQEKMVNKFIKDFKIRIGVAIARGCVKHGAECPYFVLSKDIVKINKVKK